MLNWADEDADPPWLDQPWGQLATGLLRTVRAAGLPANCCVRLGFWSDGSVVVPLTVSLARPAQSWLVSSENHFYDYAEQETRWLDRGWRHLAVGAFGALRALTAWRRLEPVVYLNNWMVSTCLSESLGEQQLASMLEEIRSTFPDYPLCFRTLSERTDRPLLERLVGGLGGRRITSRRVLFQDVVGQSLLKRRQLRNDRKVMQRSGYTIESADAWTRDDWRRAQNLYELLYLEKYSLSNPHYHWQYFQAAHQHGYLTFFGLRDPDGRLDGLLGLYRREGVQAHPIFGYDTSLDQSLGLYRTLTYLSFLQAQSSGCLAHASAGVAGFKRARGGVSDWEYTVAFTDHLDLRQRASWRVVEWLANYLARPLMRGFDL